MKLTLTVKLRFSVDCGEWLIFINVILARWRDLAAMWLIEPRPKDGRVHSLTGVRYNAVFVRHMRCL